MTAKILILDIETAPALAQVWKIWKENVPLDMLLNAGYIMSYAAKWLGEKKVYYADCRNNAEEDEKELLKQLCALLNAADIVVAHNGNKFDLPWIRGRCLVHDVDIPSPYKQVDTLLTARKEFRFLSNRLEYLARHLKCTPKEQHKKFPGYKMWEQCMLGNVQAWREMQKYNIQDINTLEEVYLKMRPYMRNHPNVAVVAEGDEHACPKCGGKHLQRRGYAYTNVGKYQRFQCTDCGGWSRTRYTEYDKNKAKELLVNAN